MLNSVGSNTLSSGLPNSLGENAFSIQNTVNSIPNAEPNSEFRISKTQRTESLKITGNLKDQLTRASSSIALNLPEGNAKPSTKEKRRYYQTAYTSLKECETIFKLANITNDELYKSADHLGACIYKLVKSELKIDTKIGPQI